MPKLETKSSSLPVESLKLSATSTGDYSSSISAVADRGPCSNLASIFILKFDYFFKFENVVCDLYV